MIQLIPQDIGQFRKLYRREMHRDISEKKAIEYLATMIFVMKSTCRGDRYKPP